MIYKALVALLMLTPAAVIHAQQQTIISKGDNNTNINAKNLVVVQVTNITTTQVLKAAAKRSLGDEAEWQGLLLPSHNKLPLICPFQEASKQLEESAVLRVRAGSNEIACHKLPCNIIQSNTTEFLKIDGKAGAIVIGAKVLDRDGNIIMTIEKNRFYVNRNRTYRPPIREDASSLKVFDEKGDIAFEIRYANPNTLIVRGTFHDGPNHTMLIDDDEIRTDTQRPGFKPSHTRTLGSCDVTYSGYAGGEIGGFNIGGTNLK
jgi:hypothetical protein